MKVKETAKMSLNSKIDFGLVFSVSNANPNGDPLNGNRPRTTYEGLGEVSDVALKRKIRNRLQDMGEKIFVQSDERRDDGFRSLKDRFDGNMNVEQVRKADKDDKSKQAEIACKEWFDIRAFGQVLAFKASGSKKSSDAEQAVSIGIRGPVSIQGAYSVNPVDISSMQITKSVNLETEKDPDKKARDTMGTKHSIDFGQYITLGSINTQLAEKTGFSDEDAEKILLALKTLFVNDASSARPEGSMEVTRVVWCKHNCKIGQYSSALVHRRIREALLNGELSVSIDIAEELTANVYDSESDATMNMPTPRENE
jgi:CRISPR-associated protein Csd2